MVGGSMGGVACQQSANFGQRPFPPQKLCMRACVRARARAHVLPPARMHCPATRSRFLNSVCRVERILDGVSVAKCW